MTSNINIRTRNISPNNISTALQELSIRLQDAANGYERISKCTNNIRLKHWLTKYANERQQMYRVLDGYISSFGGNSDLETNLLGDLNRMFIDMKTKGIDYEFDSIANEINRGNCVILNDYTKIMDEIIKPPIVGATLMRQKAKIENEVKELYKLQEEFNSVEA